LCVTVTNTKEGGQNEYEYRTPHVSI
jgi:hypothetical protein